MHWGAERFHSHCLGPRLSNERFVTHVTLSLVVFGR
jgi:hypothetical protein